jgi:hypothetical protein
MQGPAWFLRMKKWAANPPGWARVRLLFAVIAACLLLFGYERLFGWPAWLTPDTVPRGRIN